MDSGERMGRRWLAGMGLLAIASGAQAADLSHALPTKAPPPASALAGDDWTGFYVGSHFGYAAGFSNWTATQAGGSVPNLSGTLDLFEGYNFSTGQGSYSLGFQAGYNYMLPSRVVLGVETDVSFPSVLGASQAIASPLIGQAIYRDQVEMSGTVRGRIGYAPGHWLVYATGGFAYSSTNSRAPKSLAPRSAAPRLPVPSRIASWCRGSAVRSAPASRSR
jgi:hypothetical protein